MKPEDLKYAKTHEWVGVTSEGAARIATVGISAFAVEALTDLVFIELPKVGAQVDQVIYNAAADVSSGTGHKNGHDPKLIEPADNKPM